MPKISDLSIKLFADGADLKNMIEMSKLDYISGLTTNPTLMRKAGVTSYTNFAQQVLTHIPHKPISFEVFTDDLDTMIIQGEQIAAWGENVYVKIPITNTKGESTDRVISNLTSKGVKVNVTAIMTELQVGQILDSLNPGIESNISVFAGRIADTGIDPLPIMQSCLNLMKGNDNSKLIWASPRELLNVFQAESIGCHIITATTEILKKLELVGYNLEQYSLDTVQMFHKDAISAGYEI